MVLSFTRTLLFTQIGKQRWWASVWRDWPLSQQCDAGYKALASKCGLDFVLETGDSKSRVRTQLGRALNPSCMATGRWKQSAAARAALSSCAVLEKSEVTPAPKSSATSTNLGMFDEPGSWTRPLWTT